MRLTYTCRVCKKQNFLIHKEDTRADLQRKLRSDEVKVNCDNCGKFDKKHINRITAVSDNRILMVGIMIGAISTVLLWNFLGAIAVFTFSIPIFFWKYESEHAHRFNSYVIKRK